MGGNGGKLGAMGVGGVGMGRDMGYIGYCTNHLEERLLGQAQAQVSYTPLFWGGSRSTPQHMVSDDYSFIKSSI